MTSDEVHMAVARNLVELVDHCHETCRWSLRHLLSVTETMNSAFVYSLRGMLIEHTQTVNPPPRETKNRKK